MTLCGTYATFSSTTARRPDTCVGLEEEVLGNTAAIVKHRHLENKEPRLLLSTSEELKYDYPNWIHGSTIVLVQGLPRFDLLFASTIIHGIRRSAKNLNGKYSSRE